MKFLILITTYNRPADLDLLLKDIRRERRAARLSLRNSHVVVFDDGSVPSFWSIHAESYRREENGGATWYWHLVNDAFRKANGRPWDYLVMLPDDVRLKPGFFTEAARLYEGITDPRKVCLSLLVDEARQGKSQWTRYKPQPRGDVWKTGWMDLCFIAEHRFLDALRDEDGQYIQRVEPAPGVSSSGVGRQLSKRLFAAGWSMYHAAESLVTHGDHESRMHPEQRKTEPLIAR